MINTIFYRHQYGFRAKHNTIHPIIHLLNNCANATNAQIPESTLIVLCDLSKAFDVIDHKILLKKLHTCTYGIRGIANKLFESYLSGRQQYVDIDNNLSNKSEITLSVTQGSILGPLLYLIYVNDIENSCVGNILSFADDTTLFMSDSNIETLYANANKQVIALYDWFCANRLALNASKTKYIVVRPKYMKNDLNGFSIKIRNSSLERIGNDCHENSTKFFGIYVDENLTWKKHVTFVNKKIANALFSIKQVKHILPFESLRTLYYSLIQSHLSYGIIVWGNADKSVVKSTFLLQKRAIRVINNAPYNGHTDHSFVQVEFLNLTIYLNINQLYS